MQVYYQLNYYVIEHIKITLNLFVYMEYFFILQKRT